MTTAAKVSIVVPCYNAERTLTAALDSAVAQDLGVEVIVIDDGSNDASLAVARRFEPLVRVITGPNRGASAARNTGIAEGTADWIVFLDADDMLEPGTLAKRLACAHETGAHVVICDWLDVLDDGTGRLTPDAPRSVDWPALAADAQLATAAHVWATTAAILYSRALVARIGGFRADLPVIQDARFLFDAAYHGARFAHSKHMGARYRVLPDSLSRRNPARFSLDMLVNGQHIEALWRAKGTLDDPHRKAILGIYNTAGRGLFRIAHPTYFEAVQAQRRLGLPMPLHSRVAGRLARLVGLSGARSILHLVGRA